MINDILNDDLLSENPDGDILGFELYKKLTRIDAGYLNDGIEIKPVSREQMKDFLFKTLKYLGHNAAARDMRLSSDRNIKRYALWTALRFWNKHGLELVTAKSSSDQELKDDWTDYCRCLLAYMNFQP